MDIISMAQQARPKRPDGTLARPVHSLIERREDDAFVLQEIPEIVGLGQCDMFAERYTH
jgi:hypothetical protein